MRQRGKPSLHCRSELIKIAVGCLGRVIMERIGRKEDIDERDASDIRFGCSNSRRCWSQWIRQEDGITEQSLRFHWNEGGNLWSPRRRIVVALRNVRLDFARRALPRLLGIYALVDFPNGQASAAVRASGVTPLRKCVSRMAVMYITGLPSSFVCRGRIRDQIRSLDKVFD